MIRIFLHCPIISGIQGRPLSLPRQATHKRLHDAEQREKDHCMNVRIFACFGAIHAPCQGLEMAQGRHIIVSTKEVGEILGRVFIGRKREIWQRLMKNYPPRRSRNI
jgi:hypothetical protein